MHVRMTVFSTSKEGNADVDWEDKAVARYADDGSLRFVVLDGATEAFDAIRWVDEIAATYAPRPGGRGPYLDRGGMAHWFQHLQTDWARRPPAFRNLMEERKFHQVGSFATMLAGAVTGVDGPSPQWRAMALGDTVLFHVRGPEVLAQFPRLAVADFGLRPAGVSTKPARHAEMVDRLDDDGGTLESGDMLFVATDALAQWMVGRRAYDEAALCELLAGLAHPDTFAALVADLRARDQIVDDDVTLLRLVFTERAPTHLVVCL